MFTPKDVLNELEVEVSAIEVPPPLSVDRWLASSVLQKTVRRGDAETAARAAITLWQQDPKNFWRRLHTIAMEDCSAEADVVVKVLTATVSNAWYKKLGELKVAVALTRMLAKSIKCRAADEAYMVLGMSSEYAELRQELGHASDRLLTDYATDPGFSLPERCLAIWLTASSKRYPCELLPQRDGDLEKAKEVLRSMAIPQALTEACINVAKKTEYPLCWFTPLLWQNIREQGAAVQVVTTLLPASHAVEDIPLFAADVYTRIGGASFRRLRQVVPALSRFTAKQIGVMCFVVEGSVLDRFLDSPSLKSLREASERAYGESVGLSSDDYAELWWIVIENMDLLNDIRRHQLQRYVLKAPA